MQSAGDGNLCGVLGVCAQNPIAQLVLRMLLADRAQQHKAARGAVDGVAPCWKCDVVPRSIATLPNRESNQLESGQRSLGEVQFGIRQLASGIALIVRYEPDLHV